MVNLVIVSHSRQLAEGVRELAAQMAGEQIQLAAVGGIVDDQGVVCLGTDALQIANAIQQVWSEDGVLLLVDMGSAMLSAELALDFLSEEQRQRCRISSAPLVEGAVVAALEASLGHDLVQVNQAAEAAIHFQKAP